MQGTGDPNVKVRQPALKNLTVSLERQESKHIN